MFKVKKQDFPKTSPLCNALQCDHLVPEKMCIVKTIINEPYVRMGEDYDNDPYYWNNNHMIQMPQ